MIVRRWPQPRVARSSPRSAVAIDDAFLADLGRRVLDEFGCVGLASIELLADADGRLWLIDLSTRAWGCFFAFAGAGLDFATAYVTVLRDPHAIPYRDRPRPARSLRVVPAAVTDELGTLSLPRLTVALARDLRPYIRRLGVRYTAVVIGGALIGRCRLNRPDILVLPSTRD